MEYTETTYILMRKNPDGIWFTIGKELNTKGLVIGALKKSYNWSRLSIDMKTTPDDFKWVKNTKIVTREEETFKLD